MISRLFPKQVDFFELFNAGAANVMKGSALMLTLMQDTDNATIIAKAIRETEKEGDVITHDIIKKLNKTFLTPIDREDLHALATRLDDIIDILWGCAERFTLFKLSTPAPTVIEMAKDLVTCTELIAKAVKKLEEKKFSFVQEYCVEINSLENRVDRAFRDSLVKLFDETTDPILIIKWKEVYELLEDSVDACEDVANIMEAIVLKYA
jgi:predicted phosphate transport protein (TIGR00153 family)